MQYSWEFSTILLSKLVERRLRVNQQVSSQMLKGILMGCILVILSKKELYGYKISEELQHFGFDSIPKGTIYPLLMNMDKKGLVVGEMRASDEGPKRKYYHLTKDGISEKNAFIKQWAFLSSNVDRLLKESE